MGDERPAKEIMDGVRSKFPGYKFIIIFVDRREYPEVSDEMHRYLVEHNSDSFLLAGHIGDFSNEDRSDDRWNRFSNEQYDTLFSEFSLKKDPEYPVNLVLFEGDDIARLSCEADVETIWTLAMVSYSKRTNSKRPYYLIERNASIFGDLFLSPYSLARMLAIPIFIAIVLAGMLSIMPPYGYILYWAVFAIVLFLSIRISKAPNHKIFGKDITFKDISFLFSILIPGAGSIVHNKRTGTVIMTVYFVYLFAICVSGTLLGNVIPGWGKVYSIWAIVSATIFEYVALTTPVFPFLREHRFIYSNLITDFVIKLHFIPIFGYLVSIFLTVGKMGVASLIPILVMAVPIAYLIVGWLRYPVKKAVLEDWMLMDKGQLKV